VSYLPMSAVLSPTLQNIDVILSHDWLLGTRGAERVLEVLCATFKTAPVYTLFYDSSVSGPLVNQHTVRASLLQRVPGITARRGSRESLHRYLLPLFPFAVERFRLPEVDLVISSSHCAAKGIRPTGRSKHLCYCLTPMRYAWLFYRDYFGTNPVKRALLMPILSALRRWDRRSSQRVDRFVAISTCVRDRIRRFYGRDADVVFPPVETDRLTPRGSGAGSYDLVVSGLSPLKRIDLAVSVYNRTGNRLRIVGNGTQMEYLRRMAKPNIEFLGAVDDGTVLEAYRGCRMLVFPGFDDFGLVPVEAQACGKPVVAFAQGGALDTVEQGVTGVFFREQTVESLHEAIETCASTNWSRTAIRTRAERFGVDRFRQGLAVSIEKCLAR
jgi:glycosyltransferase involved in cell wall biosynthesis